MRDAIRSSWYAAVDHFRLKIVWISNPLLLSLFILGTAIANAQAQNSQPQSLGQISQLQQKIISEQDNTAATFQAVNEHIESVTVGTLESLEQSDIVFEDMRLVDTTQLAFDAVGPAIQNSSKSIRGENGELIEFSPAPTEIPEINDFIIPKGANAIKITFETNIDTHGNCSVNFYVSIAGSFLPSPEVLNSGNGDDCNSISAGKDDHQIATAIVNEVVNDLKSQVSAQLSSTTQPLSPPLVTPQPSHLPSQRQVEKSLSQNSNPKAESLSPLTDPELSAILAHIDPCWSVDAGAPGVSTFKVKLVLMTDDTGTVRNAEIASQDQSKLSNPIFAAYAERAISAAINYQCATLPLPARFLGLSQTFMINFTP